MIKKLFISKNDSELKELKAFCVEHEIELTAKSFLSFEPNVIVLEKDYDIVFFSSPRSVLFFNAQYSIAKNTKVACIGSKTKAVLESMGITVDFSGQSSDPTKVAKEFKTWCDNQVVLFPLSNISKKSISSHFSEAQKIEVVAYNTNIISQKIGANDCYVFTSPSNVIGFFDSHNTISSEPIVAWGTSTENELKKRGLNPITLKESSIATLIETIRIL
mgnify:CR=1 FL=1